MLIAKGVVGTEVRAVPLAGDVAWLDWWTKSSARELLLGSAVGLLVRSCVETVAAAGGVRGNPVPRPRQRLQTDYPPFPNRFGGAALKPALPTTPSGWDARSRPLGRPPSPHRPTQPGSSPPAPDVVSWW